MKSTAAKTNGGATFYVACGVLASVAIAQVGLAAWGYQKRAEREAASAAKPLPPVQAAPKALPDPAPAAVAPAVATTPEPIAAPVRAVPEPKPIPPTLDVPIKDAEILEQVAMGLEARQKGDTKQALEHFRTAWQKQPDHPKLIYQLAYTLELMGLPAKAQIHWNTLINLGKSAGDYYALAELQLRRKGVVSMEATEVEEREERLKFGDCEVRNAPGLHLGEKKILTINIKKNTPDKVANEDVSMVIHFFDLVNGRKVDRTTAAAPEQTLALVSPPEDWEQRGLQRFEVTYDQAQMTPEEIIQHGQRKYYGYVAELYLKDPTDPQAPERLQDLIAEPPGLENFAREIPLTIPVTEKLSPGGLDPILFPK
jgi:hypothetical protein